MKEEEKVQRAEMKEEEEKVQRAEMKEEEEKVQRAEMKEEEEKVQRTEVKEEEEKVQRACADCEKEKEVQRAPEKEEEKTIRGSGIVAGMTVSRSVATRLQSRAGQGSPLPGATRQEMSGAIGADFSAVRIHTDSEAETISQSLNAQAFTLGKDIYFNRGKYAPESQEGKRLLAHELVHVRQQGAADKETLQQKPQSKVTEFRAKKYELKNHHPPTGRGLFDIKYNPYNGRLEIKVRIKFNFIDGSATDFPLAKANHLKWTASEKKSWQKRFITLVEGRWGGKYLFRNTDAELKGIYAYVDVEVEASDKDFHFDTTVTKIPKGEKKTSSVTPPAAGASSSTANFDSEDFKFNKKSSGIKQSQQAATHEFGHMMGLGDEYGAGAVAHAALVKDALGKNIVKGNSDNIMAGGDTIEKQHYVTFWDALKKVTGMDTWEFKP